MTDTLTGPTSGAFKNLPNLRIHWDHVPIGTIETRDYEQWDPAGPLTNWWWITLRRDDGIWVEGSTSLELAADSKEALEVRTDAAIKLLLAAQHPHLSFTTLPGPLNEPEPPEAEDGDTSTMFMAVDALCVAAIREVMGGDLELSA